MEPINYSRDVLNPIEGYLQGIKFGEGINTDRLNQEATRNTMQVQQGTLDLAERQFQAEQAEIQRQNAAAQAEVAAQRARAEQGSMALMNYLDGLEAGTATPADLRRGMAAFPEMADQFQAFASSVSEERLGNELSFGKQLAFTLANGNTDAAESLLRTRQEAAEAAGDEEGAAVYQAQLIELAQNPNGVLMQTLLPIMSNMDPEEFDTFHTDILGLGGTDAEPTAGMREYEFAKSQGYEGTFADWKAGGSAQTNINVNTGDIAADPFTQTLAEAEGAQFVGFLEQGPVAVRNIARLDQLENILGNVDTGFGASAKIALGNFGIPTEGLDDLQAAQALINQLVPEQRQPGSGPMSDADLALFKQSVPRLINQPGGNARIIQTIRQINEYDAELARIAQRAAAGEITRAEAREAVNGMANPLENFGDRIGGVTRNGDDAPADNAAPTRLRYNPETGEFE